jgi:Pentapeptide repeats (8 copies)
MSNREEEHESSPSRETVKTELEIDKLRLETDKLRREGTGFGRLAALILPASQSSITAFVAILGVVISIWSLYQQRTSQDKQNHDRALQIALEMATDNKGQADRRISGIYQLQRFWINQEDEAVAAATLSALAVLPDEQDASVRCAAAEAIGAAVTQDDLKANDARVARVTRLLFGDATDGSLGLVSHANYLLRQTLDKGTHRKEFDSQDSKTATWGCMTPLAATREAIRKSWRNLRSTNLAYTDLSYDEFYEADLANANLNGAILNNTNLRCANLFKTNIQSTFNRGSDLFLANINNTISGINIPDKLSLDKSLSLSDDDWRQWRDKKFDGEVLMQWRANTYRLRSIISEA